VKYAVLKIDDLRLTNPTVQRFLDLFAWAVQECIPLSVGVIGNALLNGRRADKLYISSLVERGLLEIWNHSHRHVELTQLEAAQVQAELEDSQRAIKATIGCTPTLFGAPFNKMNDSVAEIVRQAGFKLNYEIDFDAYCRVTPEHNVPLDGQPQVRLFSDILDRRSSEPYLIVQVHPGRWTRDGFHEFKLCIELLRSRGYQFVTAQTLAALLSEDENDYPAFSARLGELFGEELEKRTAELSNYKSYFLNRFTANSIPIERLWKNWGFDTKPFSVVDVGSGLAQWSLPFLSFFPQNRVFSFDTNTTVCDALRSAKSSCKSLKNLHVVCEDFTHTTALKPRATQLVVCANALNYISVPRFLFKCAEICADGGFVVLLIQTSAFNNAGIAHARKEGNKAVLRERALSELRQELVRQGYVHLGPERTTHSVAELEALFYSQKFRLYDTFVPTWEPSYGGMPQYQGLIFQLDRSLPEVPALPANIRHQVASRLTTAGYNTDLTPVVSVSASPDYQHLAEFVESYLAENFPAAKKVFENKLQVTHSSHATICKILVEESL